MKDLLNMNLADTALDVVYTLAQERSLALTKDLAAGLDHLLVKIDSVDKEHVQLRRNIVIADAAVARHRGYAEDFCNELSNLMLSSVKQDRKDPRFQVYFRRSASVLAGLSREELVNWLSSTAVSLQKETEKPLIAAGKKAADIHANWSAALADQTMADAANEKHGISVREPLRVEINDVRRSNYAELTKLAVINKLGKKWPDRFFRASSRTPRSKTEPVPQG